MAQEPTVIANNGNEVSIQVFQDIYNTITGKRENIHNFLYDKHLINIDDIKNLHHKIQQTLEQYMHHDLDSCFIVSYSDGKSERFSGIERFELQGLNKGSPVHNIDIEYNFFILLPKTQEAKPYKIVISIRSTLGYVEYLKRTNATDIEKSFFYKFDRATGIIKIEYIDIAVARTIESQIEDWYNNVHKEPNNSIHNILYKLSDKVRIIIRILTIFGASLILYINSKDYIQTNTDLYNIILVSFTFLSIIYLISTRIASHIESMMEKAQPHSIILLSKSDQNLEKEYNKLPSRTILKSIFSIISILIIGILTSFFSSILGII